jgi:hypothetical protein
MERRRRRRRRVRKRRMLSGEDVKTLMDDARE